MATERLFGGTNFFITMRLDITRAEFDCIRNMANGVMLKAERQIREDLSRRFEAMLNPPINPNGFAPIRGYNLSNMAKPDRKLHWSYKAPQKQSKPKTAPKVLSADQILADL